MMQLHTKFGKLRIYGTKVVNQTQSMIEGQRNRHDDSYEPPKLSLWGIIITVELLSLLSNNGLELDKPEHPAKFSPHVYLSVSGNTIHYKKFVPLILMAHIKIL